MPTLQLRRQLYSMKFLYKLLRGTIDSPYLLSKININVPSRTSRNRDLFVLAKMRTDALQNSPLQKMMSLYNKLSKIHNEIDFFFDTKGNFEKKILGALVQLEISCCIVVV